MCTRCSLRFTGRKRHSISRRKSNCDTRGDALVSTGIDVAVDPSYHELYNENEWLITDKRTQYDGALFLNRPKRTIVLDDTRVTLIKRLDIKVLYRRASGREPCDKGCNKGKL